jgi:TRAP-type C4-dicarboxylate transport system permease small subunit
MVPHREHVKFDLVYKLASPRWRRVMRGAGCLLIGGLAAWALPANWDYIHFMRREGTPVLGLSFMWVFMPFALLLVALALRSAWQLLKLFSGRDEEPAE